MKIKNSIEPRDKAQGNPFLGFIQPKISPWFLHLVSSFSRTGANLAVYLCADTLYLAYFRKRQLIRHEGLFLREMVEDVVSSKVKAFLDHVKTCPTVLILPRSEVIQKELAVVNGNGSLREALETKLSQILPYPAKDMAYGFSLETNGASAKGLVSAIPEKHLLKTLQFLQRLGLNPNEIVTEDQSLLWALLDRKSTGQVLLLDYQADSILTLFVRGNRLSFSRPFPGHKELNGDLKDILQELSLALLESGGKPDQIKFSGNWPDYASDQIENYFRIKPEPLNAENENGLPACLKGGMYLGTFPVVSLLPKEKKILRLQVEQQRKIHSLSLSFLFVLGAISLVFLSHLGLQKYKLHAIEREIHSLYPQVREIKKIKQNLEAFNVAQQTKQAALDLLMGLSERIPSSVKLKELRLEEGYFILKAESLSHALMADTVDILQKTKIIKNPTLDKTRLRKRLNQEFFEFEVKGEWKP